MIGKLFIQSSKDDSGGCSRDQNQPAKQRGSCLDAMCQEILQGIKNPKPKGTEPQESVQTLHMSKEVKCLKKFQKQVYN